jgi:hypothetical protein
MHNAAVDPIAAAKVRSDPRARGSVTVACITTSRTDNGGRPSRGRPLGPMSNRPSQRGREDGKRGDPVDISKRDPISVGAI